MRGQLHIHNQPHKAHHDDEARGSIFGRPVDKWDHFRTAL